MSTGHHIADRPGAGELDRLLYEALLNSRLRVRLRRPYKLDISHDIPLLGSSSVGGSTVYIDRHLRGKPQWGVGSILIGGKRFDALAALVRHERLEQALEDEFGWTYELAHHVATRWEHELVPDPAAYEKALKPYIKADAHERLERVPTDLDLRPEIAPPRETKLIDHLRKRMEAERTPHSRVGYVHNSVRGQRCGNCAMFLNAKYQGAPACTLVRSPIAAAGWCRRWEKREGKS